jgi:hypothetical protein
VPGQSERLEATELAARDECVGVLRRRVCELERAQRAEHARELVAELIGAQRQATNTRPPTSASGGVEKAARVGRRPVIERDRIE